MYNLFCVHSGTQLVVVVSQSRIQIETEIEVLFSVWPPISLVQSSVSQQSSSSEVSEQTADKCV